MSLEIHCSLIILGLLGFWTLSIVRYSKARGLCAVTLVSSFCRTQLSRCLPDRTWGRQQSQFPNDAFLSPLQISGRWTKPNNPVIPSVMYHYQNTFESTDQPAIGRCVLSYRLRVRCLLPRNIPLLKQLVSCSVYSTLKMEACSSETSIISGII